jgi:putative colanic acid biosysnthesis UDP-glucose lipid carrier transferase
MAGLAKSIFLIGDLLFLNLVLALSFNVTASWRSEASSMSYLIIFSNLGWLFLILVSNPYQIHKGWSVSRILKNQSAFIFIHLVIVASLIFFLKKNYPVVQIGFIYLVFLPLFFGWKIFTYYLRKVFTAETLVKNYILIGDSEVSRELRRFYLLNPSLGYRFKGYFDFVDAESLSKEIGPFIEKNEVHEIFCCAPKISSISLKPLVSLGLDSLIKVNIIVDARSVQQPSLQFDRFDNEPGVTIALIPLDESRNQFVKRIFDLLFSSIILIFLMSWLMPILAIIIKIDSKGPVFFLQKRSGKNNQPFLCFKFRTMKVNHDSDKLQAMKDDPRITKLGGFLRKSSIDELPQFINVFLGDMSVVGPRPHMLKHTEEYSKLIEKFMGRHYVKPGITGLAQCMGYRGETKTLADMENRVRLDRYYIENWTFWFDIKIIFLTVVSLIRGSDKAY